MKELDKSYLVELFKVAVNEALPAVCMPKHLADIDASQGLCILGAGKAAVQMAEVIDEHFPEKCHGAIVTRYGYAKQSAIGNIKILKASHPIPDHGSLAAGQEILHIAQNNPVHIPVIFLISGGGSALLSLPIEGLAFDEKIEINDFLLSSGASINEINTVRKQLSQIKGNKLAQAVKGEYQTFIISDVVGDDPSVIASGPTVNDESTAQQAIAILHKYQWKEISSIEQLLKNAHSSRKIKRERPSKNQNTIMMANAELSINKAIEVAQSNGWETEVLSYSQEGEAKTVAKQHAKCALEALESGRKVILFSGGELTVTLAGTPGLGGPNQEYLLALAIELAGVDGVSALSCDTDGVDGNQDVAGAFINNTTLDRAKEKLMAPKSYLDNHDSFCFFNQLNDLIETGPTHTNVNDFRAIMIKAI
jgi:hydroxypyruvate reductase